MAALIAATTSTTEIAATVRSALLVAGKFSRVTPRKETSSAQMARMPPITWKAFTSRKTNGTVTSRDRGVPHHPG